MKISILALSIALATTTPAYSATVVLTFEGLQSSVNESPLEYYNGGAGSAGTVGGPDYGISFSSNTLTGCTEPNSCANTNSAGNPSGTNVIFFLEGAASTMNVAAGFETGFSFFYSSSTTPGTVNVWSGLNSTGSLLASLSLPVNSTGGDACFGTDFCPYTPFGVTFAGTAFSVDFGGANDQIGFDDITLGSATPGGVVPEPATWAMMLVGFGMTGASMRYRRKSTSFVRLT